MHKSIRIGITLNSIVFQGRRMSGIDDLIAQGHLKNQCLLKQEKT